MASVSTIIYAMHPLRKCKTKEMFHPVKNEEMEVIQSITIVSNYYKAEDRDS